MDEIAKSTTSSGRPQEGKILAMLDIFGAVLAFIGGGTFLILSIIAVGISIEERPFKFAGVFSEMMGGFAGSVGIFMILLGVLLIFMARGVLKGQKWSPIVNIIFAVLGLLNSLLYFTSEIFLLQFFGFAILLQLFISLFIIYLSVFCIKHPFYNKK